MKLRHLFLVAAILATLGLATTAQAGDGNIQDFTNFGNFDGTFDGLVATPMDEGIQIDASSFGGGFTALDNFAAKNGETLQVTAMLGPNNAAETFNVVLLDQDVDNPGTSGEGWVYTFDTSDFNDQGFTKVPFGLIGSPTSGPNPAFGRDPGDGIVNFSANPGLGMYEYQIQYDDANMGAPLDIKVALVSTVPEPTSLVMALPLLALLGFRRRRR